MSAAVTSLFDAPSEPVFGKAGSWLGGVLGGDLATALCVIAVGVFGMLLLAGRLDVRRGMKIVLGCFLLLGAGALAVQFQQFGAGVGGGGQSEVGQPVIVEPDLPPPARYDPYAGASLKQD